MTAQLIAEADRRDLVAVARTLFPHDDLADAPYERAVDVLVEACATSPVLLRVVLDGVEQLRGQLAGPIAAADPAAVVSCLSTVQGTAFFTGVRELVHGAFYADPDVRRWIGYPGPAFDLGGYLNRGFDDLAWLPEPRVLEADVPLPDIGPLPALEPQPAGVQDGAQAS